MRNHRVLAIDFIRVVTAIYLVMYHYVCAFDTIPYSTFLKPIANYGYLGVEVFFLLSGFCISMNHKRIDEGIIPFMIRRISPWYVSYVFVVLLNVCLQVVSDCIPVLEGVFPLDKPVNFFYLLTSLLLIHNGWFVDQNSPYGSGAWFLDVLVLLYIIYYIIKSVSKKNDTYIILCSLMAIIGLHLTHNPVNIIFCYNKSARGYMMFFIGVLLYEIYRTISFDSGKWIAKILLTVNLVSVVIVVICRTQGATVFVGAFYHWISVWIIPSAFLICIYLLDGRRFPITKIFSKYTTSIYMQHAMVLAEMEVVNRLMHFEFDYSKTTVFLLVCIAVILQSVLAYYLIEKRLTKAINAFVSNKMLMK